MYFFIISFLLCHTKPNVSLLQLLFWSRLWRSIYSILQPFASPLPPVVDHNNNSSIESALLQYCPAANAKCFKYYKTAKNLPSVRTARGKQREKQEVELQNNVIKARQLCVSDITGCPPPHPLPPR